MIPDFLKAREGCVHLLLHVQPGAKRTELCGLYAGRLKVRVSAPPMEGRANAEIVSYFSKLLGTKKSNLDIASGESSRSKTLEIHGLNIELVADRLTSQLKT